MATTLARPSRCWCLPPVLLASKSCWPPALAAARWPFTVPSPRNKICQLVFIITDIRSVPHVTNAIKDWIRRVALVPVDGSDDEPDVCIIELGGTVGDIESMPFVEALTQLRHESGSMNFMTVHVSYVPTIHGEQKTKPTQHAVKSVRSYGLVPDLVRISSAYPR